MLVVNTKLVAVAVLLLVIAVMVWYNSKDVEGFRMIRGRHCASSGKFCFDVNSNNCSNIDHHCTHYNTKNRPPWVRNSSARSGRRRTAIRKCKDMMRKKCSPPGCNSAISRELHCRLANTNVQYPDPATLEQKRNQCVEQLNSTCKNKIETAEQTAARLRLQLLDEQIRTNPGYFVSNMDRQMNRTCDIQTCSYNKVLEKDCNGNLSCASSNKFRYLDECAVEVDKLADDEMKNSGVDIFNYQYQRCPILDK